MRFGSIGGQYAHLTEKELVANTIKGSTVLEVGTATGRFAVSLTDRGAEYIDIDLFQEDVHATVERTNSHISVLHLDGSTLGFRSRFDYVLCMRPFHFLPQPIDSYQECSTLWWVGVNA